MNLSRMDELILSKEEGDEMTFAEYMGVILRISPVEYNDDRAMHPSVAIHDRELYREDYNRACKEASLVAEELPEL